MRKTKFFVDAAPLVEKHISGVGHSILFLTEALVGHPGFLEQYEVVLVLPRRTKERAQKLPFAHLCTMRELPFKTRIMNGLIKYHLLPRMDLLLGTGIYYFGNFRNWPLGKKSYSYTTIHDICFALHPEFVQARNQRMLIKKVPLFIKQADVITTVSETSRHEIIDYYGLPAKKVVSIYNGVDLGAYKGVTSRDIKSAQKKYGITRPYLLFVGNIEPRKNLSRLVQAFASLPTNIRDKYSLVLIGGDGWLNESIYDDIKAAQKRGADILKPGTYVSDAEVRALMSGAVGLVHPALHEGFGMPPIEAAAAGIPVAVSDIPVLREVMKDAAVYFNPLDISDIRETLQNVLTHKKLQEELSAKAKKLSQEYTWANAATAFYEQLQKNQLLTDE